MISLLNTHNKVPQKVFSYLGISMQWMVMVGESYLYCHNDSPQKLQVAMTSIKTFIFQYLGYSMCGLLFQKQRVGSDPIEYYD